MFAVKPLILDFSSCRLAIGSGGYGRGWPRGGGKQRNDTLEAGLATLSELAAEQAKGEVGVRAAI